MDELPEKDCKKIVDKEKCADKGDKCMKSCNMCEGGTTASGGGEGTTADGGDDGEKSGPC